MFGNCIPRDFNIGIGMTSEDSGVNTQVQTLRPHPPCRQLHFCAVDGIGPLSPRSFRGWIARGLALPILESRGLRCSGAFCAACPRCYNLLSRARHDGMARLTLRALNEGCVSAGNRRYLRVARAGSSDHRCLGMACADPSGCKRFRAACADSSDRKRLRAALGDSFNCKCLPVACADRCRHRCLRAASTDSSCCRRMRHGAR